MDAGEERIVNLNDALGAIAAQLDLDAALLIDYAAEDDIGGFHSDPAQAKWRVGSIWGVEGQLLYALVRAMKPDSIAECGVNDGCSTTHFLAALAANDNGELHSVDPWEGAGNGVPNHLRTGWHVYHEGGIEWLTEQPDASFDILLEDMVHGLDATRDWWQVAQRKIRPGGVVISHDAAHPGVGADVRGGIAAAGVEAQIYSIEPSDCGFAIWKAPGEYRNLTTFNKQLAELERTVPSIADEPMPEGTPEIIPPPVPEPEPPKTTRKPRTRKPRTRKTE